MPTTVEQIRTIAEQIHSARPAWDLVAVQNHLVAYRHMEPAQLGAAATACAADMSNRTPGALKWMDTQPGQSSESSFSRKSHEPICFTCGRYRHSCEQMRESERRRGVPDSHEFESSDQAERRTAARQLRDAS
jgi:hypothetical protein